MTIAVTNGCSEITCLTLKELESLVWWGPASECPYESESGAIEVSLNRKKKASFYGAMLLSEDDECVAQILRCVVDEIGFSSKSFQKHLCKNDRISCGKIKEETGSGEHSIVECVHTYWFPKNKGKGLPLAGFFFNESIRKVALSIFCKYAVYHPWVLNALLPDFFNEEQVVHISEYAREL
jgi:hypothetical protein